MKKIRAGKKEGSTIVIHGEMTIAATIKKHPKTAFVFLEYGLHCPGCPMSQPETIKEATKLHGLDLKKFLYDLNKAAKAT